MAKASDSGSHHDASPHSSRSPPQHNLSFKGGKSIDTVSEDFVITPHTKLPIIKNSHSPNRKEPSVDNEKNYNLNVNSNLNTENSPKMEH